MIQQIDYCDTVQLQSDLDSQYGAGTFTARIDKTVTPRHCYLEWADGTPQPQVDGALALAAQAGQSMLASTKSRLYTVLQITADNKIDSLVKPLYTDEEIIQAKVWLQNQSSTPPNCVLFTAYSEDLTNVQAAEKISTSKIHYDALVEQINTALTQGQTAVLNAADFYSTKDAAAYWIEQIKNIA